MPYLHEGRMGGWCAGFRVSEVEEPSDYTKAVHERLVKSVASRNRNGSCLVITINEDEKELIPHLKKFGYKKWPWVHNHAHGGRRTCMMVYNLTEDEFKKHGGFQW